MQYIMMRAHMARLAILCAISLIMPCNGMDKVRALFSRGKVLNFPIAIYSYERVKKDQYGKPMVDAQGKPVVEQLHAIGDGHMWHSFENTQVAQVVEHIEKQKKLGLDCSLGVEAGGAIINKEYTQITSFRQRIWDDLSRMWYSLRLRSKAPLAPIFLTGLSTACAANKIPIEDIEFNRVATYPGIVGGQTNIEYPNTRLIPEAVGVLEQYAQATENLAEQYGQKPIQLAYTLEGLKNLIAQKMSNQEVTEKMAVFDLYQRETGLSNDYGAMRGASWNSADTNVSTYMQKLGAHLIDQRAYVLATKYQKETDRYFALGAWHTENLNPLFKKDGWRLVHQSGIDTSKPQPNYPKLQPNNTLVGEHEAVDVAAHFNSLPARGASILPIAESLKDTKRVIGGIPLSLAPFPVKSKTPELKSIDQDEEAAKRTIKLVWD